MVQDDFDQFAGLLKQLSESFSKKLTDELTQAYWKALKDLPLIVVMRAAETHARYGKFFPKPVELRPKDAPKEGRADPDFDAAVKRNIANWDERLRQDPHRAKLMLLAAYVARIDVTEEPGSIAYEERMAFARGAARRLDLASHACDDSHMMHTASRLLGGHTIMARKPEQVTHEAESVPA